MGSCLAGENVVSVGCSGSKNGQVIELCRTSLFFLCQSMLGYPHWDQIHTDVAKFLKKPARKKALLMPRGHLKTSHVTVGWSIQNILKNPNVRILIANQIWDKSRDMLGEIKGHLEGSQLKHLFGDFVSARWNADEIIVKQRTRSMKEPTISTTGVEAETTGGHYDVIILDDLTGLQNSQTPEQREKTKRFRRSMINLLEPGGLLVEIGTRWHLDDTFSEILEKESKYYDILVRKIVENGRLVFPTKFAKKFDGLKKDWVDVDDPTCMDYVDHLKSSMPLDEFSAQYLNEPFSNESQLFKPEMFKYWTERPGGLYVGMAVDLAISETAGSDSTAIVVAGMDKDWKLYVLDHLSGRWKPADIVRNVFDMQSRWRPYVVGMETNGFQCMLKSACEEEMRSRGQYFGIEGIKTGPTLSKESRIKSLEPFYRSGNVSHAAWMRGKEMEVELQTFPKGRHDDIIDALSMCLPLLSAGSDTTEDRSKPGTYDYEVQDAQRFYNRQTGYFNF